MNKKKTMRTVAVVLGTALSVSALGVLTGCKKTSRLVVMTEALNGLFNPFYSTSGTDMNVVGMTQLSMLTTDASGHVAYGQDEATVVLDYATSFNANEGDSGKGVTTYYFVLKNGIKYSDGKPLTMNDVLFNMYVYLDPVYTGSSTMYSTDIVGLTKYRTQQNNSSGAGSADDALSLGANSRAQDRIQELINVFEATGKITGTGGSVSYSATEEQMQNAIASWSSFSDGFKSAISNKELTVEEYRAQLKADYEFTLKTFKEELQSDYDSAKDSFTEDPYKSTGEFDEITSFMYMEGYVTLKYKQEAGGTADRNQIEEVRRNYSQSVVNTKDKAIEYVYNDRVSTALNEILQFYATGTTVRTDFISKATEVILHENLQEGELPFDSVEGIVSMGHEAGVTDTQITTSNGVYKIARQHNEDGTVANEGEYDVLRIKINGVDPKAIWNFGFSVAPYHYYSNPDDPNCAMNIAQHKFGVQWGSYDFMRNVIQGTNSYGASKNQVPVGAGPYAATNSSGKSETPSGGDFYNSGIVYYKANENFLLGAPKIKLLCYQVVSSTNALDMLASGAVHYVTPQLTDDNARRIESLGSKGISSKSTWQLGYGYIGVNAGKVQDINLRKAIMSAMDIRRALSYYSAGTVANIAYPMSLVSWAYPRQDGYTFDPDNPLNGRESNNGKDYMMFTDDTTALQKIDDYMRAAGVSANDSRLKIKFTIAGSNLTEHPIYSVFTHAATLLNSKGWQIDVVPDTNALTKLSTGSLTVWAAAWGSTIDPDMYQVYHKNSTATSVLSWGYREILANQGGYPTENDIITKMSTVIEQARETNDETVRTGLYKTAMDYVLQLAVELPVYQRQELFAYNAKVIDESTLPATINSYSSPLGKIWEVDFAK